MTIVVDASALVAATATTSAGAAELRERLVTDVSHAPHLIDAEVGNVLRRMVLRRALHPDHATELMRRAPGLIDHRYEHRGPLAVRAWSLRANLTFYDALYVALAALLDTVLITADAALAAAPRLPCRVHVLR